MLLRGLQIYTSIGASKGTCLLYNRWYEHVSIPAMSAECECVFSDKLN
jgi:hypothetical protein